VWSLTNPHRNGRNEGNEKGRPKPWAGVRAMLTVSRGRQLSSEGMASASSAEREVINKNAWILRSRIFLRLLTESQGSWTMQNVKFALLSSVSVSQGEGSGSLTI